MSYYYIVKYAIKEFSEPLSSDYSYQMLTPEQVTFYKANPNCSIAEILATKKNIASLDDVKNAKIGELEGTASSLISAGYNDTNFNVTLAINESDISAFNNLLTLNSIAEGLGQTIGEQTITDINGNPVTLSYTNLKILLLSMGAYVQSIWQNLATKKATVKAATTKTAVNAIKW